MARIAINGLGRIAGRKPVIATVSHFSTAVVEDRGREAAAMGAAMLMMMPPYQGTGLRAEEAAVFEHFEARRRRRRHPVQDAPLSGVTVPVPFLVRMAREIEQVSLFKIETPQASAKLRELIAAGRGRDRGPVRRRGGGHALGRFGRRRDGDDDIGAVAGPHTASRFGAS